MEWKFFSQRRLFPHFRHSNVRVRFWSEKRIAGESLSGHFQPLCKKSVRTVSVLADFQFPQQKPGVAAISQKHRRTAGDEPSVGLEGKIPLRESDGAFPVIRSFLIRCFFSLDAAIYDGRGTNPPPVILSAADSASALDIRRFRTATGFALSPENKLSGCERQPPPRKGRAICEQYIARYVIFISQRRS